MLVVGLDIQIPGKVGSPPRFVSQVPSFDFQRLPVENRRPNSKPEPRWRAC